MANFKYAFDKTVKAEGGYVNDPNDAGGETYLGISRKNHPTSKMWKIIDETKKKYGTKGLGSVLKTNKTLDGIAEDIYKKQYWDVLKLDKVKSQKIAEQLFDMGVNAGPVTAIRLAQKVLRMPMTGKITDDLIKKLQTYEPTT
jgi:lysozyme family protein